MSKRRNRRIAAKARAQHQHQQIVEAQRAADAAQRRATRAEQVATSMRVASFSSGQVPQGDSFMESVKKELAAHMAHKIAEAAMADQNFSAEVVYAVRQVARDMAHGMYITMNSPIRPALSAYQDENHGGYTISASLPALEMRYAMSRGQLLFAR